MGILSLPNAKVEIGSGFKNPSFETGDLTNWDYDSITIEEVPRTGVYSAYTGLLGQGSYIEQDSLAIRVDEITSCSFWGKKPGSCPSPNEARLEITATYTDATTTVFEAVVGTNWTEVDIYAELTAGKTVDKIRVEMIANCFAYLDDFTPAKVEPHDETILAINIHLGCTNEVSSFEIIIDRGNSDYDNALDPTETNALTNGDIVVIYMGRTFEPLLLTGILEEIEYLDEVEDYEFRNIVRCSGRCDGYQLFARKFNGDLIALVDADSDLQYRRSSGEAESLIAYIIDNYTSLPHYRESELMGANAAADQADVTVADGSIFAANDLVRIGDDNDWEYNKIASIADDVLTMDNNLNHAYTTAANGYVRKDLIRYTSTRYTEMRYSYTTIYEILKFICDTADLSGIIGYDMRIEYDGKFAFFSRETLSESYSLQDQIQLSRYSKVASRIKNKITVFGKEDKPYPLDTDGQAYSDAWTDKAVPFNKSELSLDAAASQAVIRIPAGDGAQYAVDDWIWIIDSSTYGEILQVDSISAGTGPGGEDEITFKTNLVGAYTTANNAIIFEIWSNGGWGFEPDNANDDITVDDSATKTTGSYGVQVVGNNVISTYSVLMCLLTAEKFSMDYYPYIKMHLYFSATKPSNIQIRLLSGDLTDVGAANTALSFPINITVVDKWQEIVVMGGTDNPEQWTVGGSFDWTDIGGIEIIAYYAAGGTYTFYIDRMHAAGGRWGGGTSDAASDGFAEDFTSQSTYGVRESVVISDLLLSDAECEAKAQAYLAYYKDERLSIEINADAFDYESYNPMAGNKVAADLDLLGVTGNSYRIDSIDIMFRALSNSLLMTYILDKTPTRTADYLHRLRKRVTEIERDYSTIR